MKNNIIFILGIFLIIIGIGTTITGFILNEEGTIGDCYDKHNNKIIGQQCELEVSEDAKPFLGVGFTMFLLGFALTLMGMLDDFNERYKD